MTLLLFNLDHLFQSLLIFCVKRKRVNETVKRINETSYSGYYVIESYQHF